MSDMLVCLQMCRCFCRGVATSTGRWKMGGLHVVGNKVNLDPLNREQGNKTICFGLEVVNLLCSYE